MVCGTTDPVLAHLRAVDPVLGALIDRIGPDALGDRRRARPSDHWGVLVRAILAQQVSTHAADAMLARLQAFFGGAMPTPEQIAQADPEAFRPAAGLSRAKTLYLRSLADHVLDGSLELDRLGELDDAAVRTALTAVKGIGPWSADVFLIFHLGRPDVLPVGDLGVRRAMGRLYDLDGDPAPATMREIAAPWRPYRTRASLYLWRSLDGAAAQPPKPPPPPESWEPSDPTAPLAS